MELLNLPKMPKTIKRFPTPSGSKEKVTYKYEYDPKYGCPRRVVSGKVDLQAYIQASADDVDFKAIGKMLVDNRDNVLSHFELEGETMDITGLPRNIHEYEALHNKMLKSYEGLPSDIKALFSNDFDVFASSWKNGTIGTVLNNYYTSQSQKADVKTDENGEVK